MNLSGRRAAGVVDRDDVFAIGDRVGGEVVGDWRELAVERGADDAASRHHPSNRQFPDRDAILVALIDRASRNPSACEAAAVASEPGVARVRAMSHAYLRVAPRAPKRVPHPLRAITSEPRRPRASSPVGPTRVQILSDAFADLPVASGRSAPEYSLQNAQALWVALHGTVTVVPAAPGSRGHRPPASSIGSSTT